MTNDSATNHLPRGRPRWRRRILVTLLVVLLVPLALFVVNGTILSQGEAPFSATTSHPAAPLPESGTIKILSYNIAKGYAHKGGIDFESAAVVQARIDGIAKLIRGEQPDLVFLSEAVIECGPCPVDQVRSLAEGTGMHTWAFGENYNFGVPLYRVVGGNAILCRWPLEVVGNPSLAGRQPFWITKNNRRFLLCAVNFGGHRILLGSIHNDSFNDENNLKQMQQILNLIGDAPSILAGDFNARPDEPSIQLIRDLARFSGKFDGPMTFPARRPDQTIDFIFAPEGWRLVEHRVIDSQLSDHCPIISVFEFAE